MNNLEQHQNNETSNASTSPRKPLIPLSKKQAEQLIMQYQKGKQANATDAERITSVQAWKRLLTAMQPFVATIVSRYAAGQATPSQLRQAGNRGLRRAMLKFDPIKQPKLSSWVISSIRAEINRLPSMPAD